MRYGTILFCRIFERPSSFLPVRRFCVSKTWPLHSAEPARSSYARGSYFHTDSPILAAQTPVSVASTSGAIQANDLGDDSYGTTLLALSARNVLGTVKWYNTRNGYGFATRSDTNEDVYVHARDIAAKNPSHAKPSLRAGETIQFDVVCNTSEKSQRAARVTGPNGSSVKGDFHMALQNFAPRLGSSFFQEGDLIERNVKGVVKSYSLISRWGFITRADTGNDIFVCSKGIVGKNPSHALRSLQPGEPVQFHVHRDAKGKFTAVAVTGPEGKTLQGHVDATGPLGVRCLNGEFRNYKLKFS